MSQNETANVQIRVRLNSPVSKIVFDAHTNEITAYLRSSPVRGEANRELIKTFRKKLNVDSLQVAIISGHHSHSKILRIVGLTKEDVVERIRKIE